MKLRNKKTGEIIETCEIFENLYGKIRIRKNGIESYDYEYNSLAELAEEWEDVPEKLKEYWFMDYGGRIKAMNDANDEEDMARKELGNYFETKEEAEKAVEKLKAWKRLKDKGYRFIGKTYETDKRFGSIFYKVDDDTYSEDIVGDLDLLFGGEE
ncbi:hypothetical protein J6S37_00475 [Candidatus Saccharibacteria bacterium]|nr:hypothetical protein [Candidatus Saccharibacteria bacterium]